MNNIQCYLGRKHIFYILNWLVRVTVTALFTLWLDKQTFGFQKYSVACFDKWPLIMIDKCRRDILSPYALSCSREQVVVYYYYYYCDRFLKVTSFASIAGSHPSWSILSRDREHQRVWARIVKILFKLKSAAREWLGMSAVPNSWSQWCYSITPVL